MKNSIALLVVYYINNYLLSFNLLVGLFLLFEILSMVFGINSSIEIDRTDYSQFMIGLSLMSCILCVTGLFMSFKSLDAIRLGNTISKIDQKNFRAASILTTISGVLFFLQLQDVQSDSLLTFKFNNSSFLTISWYGTFLVLIGQFFRFLSRK